jgi:hypothetical protein
MHQYDLVACRRVNYLQAAMVQAAISIQNSHGREVAIAVLLAEHVSVTVIDRVLEDTPNKRRWPYSALQQPASLLPD